MANWFTGLAGKAEELLNKVDQSAAESLNTSQISQPRSGSSTPLPEASTDGSSWSQPSHAASTANPNPPRTSPQLPRSSARQDSSGALSVNTGLTPPRPVVLSTSSPGQRSSSKKNLDDELFEFLNKSEKPPENRTLKKLHSRQSSTGSNKTNDSGLQFVASPNTPTEIQPSNNSPTGQSSGGTSEFEVVDASAAQVDNTGVMTASVTSLPDQTAETCKTLELENGLLKSEITSLNNEMTALIQRVKHAEHDLSESRSYVDKYTTDISKLQTELREFRDRETDLNESIRAKDTQVAILRVRMDELESDNNTKSSRLAEVEKERERILRDHTDSSGLHNSALQSLQDKLRHAESQIKLERESNQKSHEELSTRHTQITADRLQMSENITQLQKKIKDTQHKNDNLNSQLKSSRTQTELSNKQLQDYKDKAAKILQSKERMIAALQDSTDPSSSGSGTTGGGVLQVSISNLEQEKSLLKQELQAANQQIEQLNTEIQDMETQMATSHEEYREHLTELEDKLSQENNKYSQLEHELSSKQSELSYIQEQMMTVRTSLQTQVNEREGEIEKLRTQLKTKQLNTSSEQELEHRLHSLTENLIEKQTIVESLTTEKSSLKLQLERSEGKIRELEQQTSQSTHVYIGEEDASIRQRGNPMSGGINQNTGFLKESPTDPEFTKKVKQAANTIDRFSIRLGIFLRRYPIARVLILIYMLLLHFWVMIVLLTYQPEMHGLDQHALPQPLNEKYPKS